jgi:hypothetical protein
MSLDRFSEQIRNTLDSANIPHRVGLSTINDFMRALHEIFVKGGRDQRLLLNQVAFALGTAASAHLMRLLDLRPTGRSRTACLRQGSLEWAIKAICAERGIEEIVVFSLLRVFLSAFDQERVEKDGSEISKTWLLYFGIRDEAAYHFGGLFTGDDRDEIGVEQEYLDGRLKRFCAFVNMWELEKKWDDAEAALEAKYSHEDIHIEPAAVSVPEIRESGSEADEMRAIRIQDEIIEATIRSLIAMPQDCRLSGEDTILANVWEEICAQVQNEYSFSWDAYVDTMRTFLEGFLEDRSPADKVILFRNSSDDETVEDLMGALLARAADYESDNVSRFNCWRTEDENDEA